MEVSRHLSLVNNLDEIIQLGEFVEEICETIHLDAESTMGMNLAMEEAVVNVINYAYPEGTTGDIHVEAHADDTSLTFVIRDSGKPFDPTAVKEPDTSLPAEERPIGGLGIYLIRSYMDEVSYERTTASPKGENVLTLVKKLT